MRAHYLDELDGQRALAHAAAAHDHQLVSLAGRGVPGSRPPAPGPPPPSPGRRPAAHVATAAAAVATAWGGVRRNQGVGYANKNCINMSSGLQDARLPMLREKARPGKGRSYINK